MKSKPESETPPQPPKASAFELALLAAVLALGKSEKQSSWGAHEFLGSAEVLLDAARNRLNASCESSVTKAMGWEVYHFKEIAEKDLLKPSHAYVPSGESDSCLGLFRTIKLRRVQDLAKECFGVDSYREMLNKGGLSHSELDQLRRYHLLKLIEDRKRKTKLSISRPGKEKRRQRKS